MSASARRDRGVLLHPPSEQELERLYHELAAHGAPSVGSPAPWPYSPTSKESLFVLAAEALRYDPRLLSILLQWALEHRDRFDISALRRGMEAMRWPQAMLVVWAFAREAEPRDRELGHVVDYLSADWAPVSPPERFFFGVERPGTKRAQARLGRSLRPYRRWGFLGTERPTADVRTKRTVGRYDEPTRRRIAAELAERRGVISVREYLEAIDQSVGRHQAIKDLRAAGLSPSGRGRGAVWKTDGQ